MDFRAPAPLATLPAGPDLATVAGNLHRGANRNVAKIADEFEGLFCSLLLKQMRQTLEPDGLFGADGADIRGGLFDLYLGQHLARAGGLGLADMLKRHLKTRTPDEPTPAALPSQPRPA